MKIDESLVREATDKPSTNIFYMNGKKCMTVIEPERPDYTAYNSIQRWDSEQADDDLVSTITKSFERLCEQEGFTEMKDLTYQVAYAPNSDSDIFPYVHAWSANFC